ncbi:MAG: GNAT family N-acetyltransferase [Cytophagales bacterium]|nr:GNAT family N-acetyltransferase [Cytophagales bacterium]
MEIRKASLSDLHHLVPLFDAFRQCYEKPSDLTASTNYLAERLKNDESVIFMAVENDEITGFAQLYPTFSSISLKKYWMLNDLYVSPSFRKQGIAKLLINRTKQMAKDTDSMGIIIETRITNNSANYLYDSVGFQKDGEHLFYFLEA